mgnify:CR=1 FL=1
MDIKEVVKKRYACRSYKNIPVPEDKIKSILEAARLAPSASNRQPYKFIIVKDKNTREKLAEAAAGQNFIASAPIIIVGVSLEPEKVMSSDVPTYAVDLAIAMEHIALQATAEGLGTCWIGAFSQQEVKDLLEIPEQYKVVALMPLGYPADYPKQKIRKDLKELVSYEKFK